MFKRGLGTVGSSSWRAGKVLFASALLGVFAVPAAVRAVNYQIVYVPVTIVVGGRTVVVRRPVVRPVATQPPVALTFTVVGNGSVASTPAGIACGADCAETYPKGATVTLRATPATNQTFSGWSGGGCSGTVDCSITLSAATNRHRHLHGG